MFHFIRRVEDGLCAQSVDLGEDWSDDSDTTDFDIDIDLKWVEAAASQVEKAPDA